MKLHEKQNLKESAWDMNDYKFKKQRVYSRLRLPGLSACSKAVSGLQNGGGRVKIGLIANADGAKGIHIFPI